jgi:hypothetical protein
VIRNSLLAVLLRDAPEWREAPVELVDLPFGPWTLEPSNPFVYFPIDALLTFSHARAVHDAVDVVDVAVVGQHACVGPSELWGMSMHAVVIVPGQAYRIDWTQVKQDPQRYADWLWHTTVVTHGLIEQMAQTAFCVRHHTPVQRLASWLLMASGQFVGASLRLPLEALPASISQRSESRAQTLDTLQALQAIALEGDSLHVLDAQRLAAAACRCHTRVTSAAVAPRPRPL